MTKILEKYKSLPMQVKASVWFVMCSFLQRGISTLTTPIFTRLLSTAEYGSYNVFNSWLGIATIFVSINLYAGVYGQGLIKFEKERDVFSSSLQGLTLTLVTAWMIIYLFFRNFWNNLFSLTTVQMIAMLLMIWTSAVFGFWAAEQRVKLSYVKLVIVTLIVSVAKPTIGIIFVTHAKDKVTSRILGIVLVEVMCYTGMFFSQMLRGKKYFSARFWKYVLAFNLPLIPHYLSQTVLSSSDRIMIENMVGKSEAGIYSLAYSVALVMILFNNAISQAIEPWCFQKIKSKRFNDIEPVTFGSMVVIAIVNIMLIAFAPEIITIFAPSSYRDAIWAVPPIAMSVYFMYAYDTFSRVEFYYEKTNYLMTASLMAAILNITLNYICIPRVGYIAAAYTTLFCYMSYALFHYICMNRICKKCIDGIRIYSTKNLILLTLSFLLIGFIFLLTYYNRILRYTVVAILLITIIIKRKAITNYLKLILQSKKETNR